jgi:hypothetical protein
MRGKERFSAPGKSQRVSTVILRFSAGKLATPSFFLTFFDLFVSACTRPDVFQSPPETRHPERSASQIYRIRRGSYGAESKDPGDARWQMLFQAFPPQTTRKLKSDRRPERTRISCYAALTNAGVCGCENLGKGSAKAMTIEIHNPHLVQRLTMQIRTGRFHDAEELIEKALDALDERTAATSPTTETGALVLAALQDSPYPDAGEHQ